jgi:hypothetical protein
LEAMTAFSSPFLRTLNQVLQGPPQDPTMERDSIKVIRSPYRHRLVHPCYHHSNLSTEERPEGGRERLTDGIATFWLKGEVFKFKSAEMRSLQRMESGGLILQTHSPFVQWESSATLFKGHESKVLELYDHVTALDVSEPRKGLCT